MEAANQKEKERIESTATLMDDVPTKVSAARKKVLPTNMKLPLQTIREEALTDDSR